MKKFNLLLSLLAVATVAYAQEEPKCSCPPMKLYVYDTKIDFPLDTPATGVSAGDYLNAQNSGDWLDGDLEKQRSDEFQVYKSFGPGATTGNTYQPVPPPDAGATPSGIDFVSYARITRQGGPGTYYYTVQLIIMDPMRQQYVVNLSSDTKDLGDVDGMIDVLIGTLGYVPDKLRDYQKKIRDEHNPGDEWIGLKWKSYPDKQYLKLNESINVRVQLFDCLDDKPATKQDVPIKLTNTDIGSLSVDHIKTDDSGEGKVTFKAKKNGYTRVLADFTFLGVNGKTSNATPCTDQKDIIVADAVYKIKMQAELTGPEGIHYKLTGESNASLVSYADSTYGLRPVDGTKNMQITVETAGIPGKMSLISPLKYNIPYVINVGNVGKELKKTASAKISIESFSPTDNKGISEPETYQMPGTTLVLMNNISQMFSAAFMKNTMKSTMDNGTKAQQDVAFIQRLRANKNNPAYFKTAQGKADLQQLQKLSQENGHGLSDMYAGAGGAPKGKANAYNTAFVQGIKATQTNPAGAPNAYKPTVIGGLFHADGTFHPQGTAAMEVDQEEDSGDIHGSLKLTVQKVQ